MKYSTRLLSVVLSAVIFLSVVMTAPVSVNASDTEGAVVNGIKCNVGAEIEFVINLKTDYYMEDMQGYIKYPSEGLSIESCTFNDELKKGNFVYNTNYPDSILFNTVTIMKPMNFLTEKQFIRVVFKVTKQGEWGINGDFVTLHNTESQNLIGDDGTKITYTTSLITTKVIYKGNGGTSVPEVQKKSDNSDLQLSNKIPVRKGYKFLGWSENKNAKTPRYKAGEIYTENRDITLYAVWKLKNLQTVYGIKSTYTKTYGSTAFTIPAKSRENGKLTFVSGNKKVCTVSSNGKFYIKGYGKTTIKITAAETSNYRTNYRKIIITVVPKMVSKTGFKAVKSGKSAVKMSWVRDKTVTGYFAQLSQRKNFSSRKNIKINSDKKSLIIKNLKNGRTYYTRIRAYKTLAGKKYYGPWRVITIKM